MLNLRGRHRFQALASVYRYLNNQPQYSVPHIEDTGFSEVPIYPEIQDLSFRARKRREAEDFHEAIRQTRTVEEKLIKINMPKYYGYKVVRLDDETFPYNSLPAIQHYTRTAIEKSIEGVKPATTDGATSSEVNTKEKQLDALLNAARTDVMDALEFANDFYKHKYPADVELEANERVDILAQIIVEQVHRAVVNALAADFQYLHEIETDYNPRHEAFWAVGGIEPPRNVVKSKEGREWQKEMAHDKVDRLLRYSGTPYLAVRHKNQLTNWKTKEEYENLEKAKEIPRYDLDPRTLGFSPEYKHATAIPGYWPGSKSGFGCISYQRRTNVVARPNSLDDYKENLMGHAIQSSFAWLLAQANYNGFNTYNDLTYPMNTQTIVTNGRTWSFYEYQLNTLLTHSHHVDENPKMNFCRGTDELDLYKEFDESGKCIGFYEEPLRHLLQFYMNAPAIQRTQEELQPYVDAQHKVIADYPEADKREFLERTFKHLVANRPRHLALPEIYLWEKIYKIDNKTRPLEARRRFFELDINPWKRTLDQHQKEYIPRVLRENGPKDKKNKWKKTYYP